VTDEDRWMPYANLTLNDERQSTRRQSVERQTASNDQYQCRHHRGGRQENVGWSPICFHRRSECSSDTTSLYSYRRRPGVSGCSWLPHSGTNCKLLGDVVDSPSLAPWLPFITGWNHFYFLIHIPWQFEICFVFFSDWFTCNKKEHQYQFRNLG